MLLTSQYFGFTKRMDDLTSLSLNFFQNELQQVGSNRDGELLAILHFQFTFLPLDFANVVDIDQI